MPDITIAMRALERAVASRPQTEAWRSQVDSHVQRLREAYAQEMECATGYDAFALDSTPWLHGRLQMLRREQCRILEDLESLHRVCVEAMDFETLRARVMATVQRITRVRQRENDLIYESVDLDLGGEQ